MKARLSVLDLSPVGGEATQAQAMRETIAVAQAAERLGYDRFWVAEHHNMRSLASASPEILMAALTQATKTIRLGSGGVMLVNYSPLKVAEVFMALEALAPGRIDLGVGRALGTDGRTGGALRSAGSEAFPQYFALLNAWLLDAGGVEPITEAHPARGIHASPSGPSHPDIFLLCSSPETADFAGRAAAPAARFPHPLPALPVLLPRAPLAFCASRAAAGVRPRCFGAAVPLCWALRVAGRRRRVLAGRRDRRPESLAAVACP